MQDHERPLKNITVGSAALFGEELVELKVESDEGSFLDHGKLAMAAL